MIDESFERYGHGNIVKIVRGGSEEITLGRGPTGAVDAIDAARVLFIAAPERCRLPRTSRRRRRRDRRVQRRRPVALREMERTGRRRGELPADHRVRASSLGVGGISTPTERDAERGPHRGSVCSLGGNSIPPRAWSGVDVRRVVTVKVDYDEDGQATAVEDHCCRLAAAVHAVTKSGSGARPHRDGRCDNIDHGLRLRLRRPSGATSSGRCGTTEVGADGYFATVEGEPATTDPAGRLTALGPTTFTYDTAGRVASMTDVHGVTAYELHGLGRLAGVRLPDGRHITYTHRWRRTTHCPRRRR